MTFEEARALFPVLERFAYLNAGTFGPLARQTTLALTEQARRDAEQGRSGKPYVDKVLELRAALRARLAGLLATAPEHIALTSSTTDGCNIVLAGLGLRTEDEIVTTDAEHFGLAGPVLAAGATVRVARIQQLGPEQALDAIIAEVTPRTRLLAVSHVYWTTGIILDVHALKEQTRLPLLVDGAQSVGAIPVGVRELDFYTVSGQKWLCGPDSTGGLYVADPESLRVARPSYFAQESFEPGGSFVPKPGAARFDGGWIGSASLGGLIAAIGVAPDWRYQHIAKLSAYCRAALAECVEVVTPPGQAGLVTFVPKGDPEETARRLFERDVVVRNLPGTPWVRASCGWWTNDDDVDRLVRGI